MPNFHSSAEMYELENAFVKANTLRAILVSPEEQEAEPVWIPKSQIELVTRNGKTVEPLANDPPVTIRMTAWIAKQKGFI